MHHRLKMERMKKEIIIFKADDLADFNDHKKYCNGQHSQQLFAIHVTVT